MKQLGLWWCAPVVPGLGRVVEAVGLGIQGHPQRRSKLVASMGHNENLS